MTAHDDTGLFFGCPDVDAAYARHKHPSIVGAEVVQEKSSG